MSLTHNEELMIGHYFLDADGKKWRRNGKTKTWKTRPKDFRIPIKFGLYAYGYIDQDNAHLFRVNKET